MIINVVLIGCHPCFVDTFDVMAEVPTVSLSRQEGSVILERGFSPSLWKTGKKYSKKVCWIGFILSAKIVIFLAQKFAFHYFQCF